MPFDGIEYGVQPLIGPPQHLPGFRCVGDILRRAMAAGYGYMRTNHGFVGQTAWQQHPRRDSVQVTGGTLASPQDISVFRSYLPAWATHVVGALHYYAEELPAATVGLRITVDSDVGSLIQQQHEALETQDVSNASLRPVTFQSGVIESFIERTIQTASDALITVAFGADNTEEASFQRVQVRPQLLTLYWISVG